MQENLIENKLDKLPFAGAVTKSLYKDKNRKKENLSFKKFTIIDHTR